MMALSLARSLQGRRTPKISEILWAIRRQSLIWQLRSSSLWIGKRLKMKEEAAGALLQQPAQPRPHAVFFADPLFGPFDLGVWWWRAKASTRFWQSWVRSTSRCSPRSPRWTASVHSAGLPLSQ